MLHLSEHGTNINGPIHHGPIPMPIQHGPIQQGPLKNGPIKHGPIQHGLIQRGPIPPSLIQLLPQGLEPPSLTILHLQSLWIQI